MHSIIPQAVTASSANSLELGINFEPSSTTWISIVERPRDRVMRLSDALADHVARLMEAGADEVLFQPFAEASDELARLAEFLEPSVVATITYWPPQLGGGTVTRVAQ